MIREIFALARKYRRSTYDASYLDLDLAMKRGVCIATFDERLVSAARQNHIEIFGLLADKVRFD
jgi:predicted nucleic acid-binding protein